MSLGETLRRAREMRRVSVNQAALETRIRQSVLESLEDGDYSGLPPRPFLRGLLRNYALYLQLDADSVLEEFDIETGHPPPAPRIPRAPEPPPQEAPPVYTPPAPVYTPPPAMFAEPPEPEPEEFAFPPFQIPTSPRTNGDAEITPPPPAPLETVFQVAPELEQEAPPPTPPLNISQKPPTLGQRIGGTRIPEAVAFIAIAVTVFALISVGFTSLQNFPNPFAAAATPEPTDLPTPTIPPGSTPTGIPTIAQTPEAATVPVIVLETSAPIPGTVTPGSTVPTQIALATATPDLPLDAQMTLTIDAVGDVGAWVIVDEDSVFNGTLRNESRSFTARSRLYVQIKNVENGRVFFQGTRILPRNQEERSELNRAWLMNPLGTPVIVPPTPYPSPVAPTVPPTQTRVPTNTSTRTATATATATRTGTATATATGTATRTATATATGTATGTATATATRTAMRTSTATATRTSTATRTRTPTRVVIATRTATRTGTAARSSTPTRTRTATGTRTRTRTATATPTRSLTP